MEYVPRYRKKYRDEVIALLMKEFEYANPMQVPRLSKITVNMGLGEAVQNGKLVDAATDELTRITGQKAVVTRARKSIAGFKLRQGMPIGCMVTLRKDRMWEFMDRLVTFAMPMTRDFKGVSPKAFDGRGNYTLGIREQIIFPEIDYDKVDKIKGMNISDRDDRDATTKRGARCCAASACRSASEPGDLSHDDRSHRGHADPKSGTLASRDASRSAEMPAFEAQAVPHRQDPEAGRLHLGRTKDDDRTFTVPMKYLLHRTQRCASSRASSARVVAPGAATTCVTPPFRRSGDNGLGVAHSLDLQGRHDGPQRAGSQRRRRGPLRGVVMGEAAIEKQSRNGKKPVALPQGVEVKIDGQRLEVKGPKGSIVREFRSPRSCRRRTATAARRRARRRRRQGRSLSSRASRARSSATWSRA